MASVGSGSYRHRIHRIAHDDYEISWRVDFKYGGSRLRHAQVRRRYTDKKGAERFAKKWNVPMPEEK